MGQKSVEDVGCSTKGNIGHPMTDHEGRLAAVGETQNYISSLSCRQMESLTALCDTFLPAVDIISDDTFDESVVNFFQTSASMTATPQLIGGLLTERLKHPKIFLIKLVLWLLSTSIGTFILCGIPSLSSNFPYLQSFSQLSPKKREEVVLSWSVSCFSLLRMLFIGVKYLSVLVFFTKVNERNENPSWKAIGYSGPDPDFKTQIQKTRRSTEMSHEISIYKEEEEDLDKTEVFVTHERSIYKKEEEKDLDKTELFGPLYKGIIDMKQTQEAVAESLKRSGFWVSTCHGKNKNSYSFNPYLTIKCDAVVIGSGSGGGVIAGVLAKAGYKVLVLEKGSYCARSNLSLLEGHAMDNMYLGHGLLATNDIGVVILAGSTVGGGSTINWSASLQTPPHVIKEWSETYDLELFDSKFYRDAMDIVCQKMGVQSEIDDEGFNNMVLRRGCQELGYPVNNIPRNSPQDHYCGWCCLGCKDGRKKGTSETWLADLVNSGNGAILPECEAIEVLHEHKKGMTRRTATGVAFEFHREGVQEVCVVESKVTIVACGALCTPALLKRSGLKNPHIGRNLHLHPVTMAWGYFPDTPSTSVWPAAEKKSHEGGIMTAMSTLVGNFETSGYGAIIQTPALHPGMFSALMPWVSGIDFKRRMCKFSRTAHIFALARDKGSGELASPTSISYQMDSTDEENLKIGQEKVLRILAAAGAEEIGTHHRNGKTINVKQMSSQAFERFVEKESSHALRNLSTPICSAHQMGSCRMGVNPNDSAVNPMGETWEVEGLYVADSSVFPTALGVNPMVTVQAISYCTAQSVLEILKRKKNKW